MKRSTRVASARAATAAVSSPLEALSGCHFNSSARSSRRAASGPEAWAAASAARTSTSGLAAVAVAVAAAAGAGRPNWKPACCPRAGRALLLGSCPASVFGSGVAELRCAVACAPWVPLADAGAGHGLGGGGGGRGGLPLAPACALCRKSHLASPSSLPVSVESESSPSSSPQGVALQRQSTSEHCTAAARSCLGLLMRDVVRASPRANARWRSSPPWAATELTAGAGSPAALMYMRVREQVVQRVAEGTAGAALGLRRRREGLRGRGPGGGAMAGVPSLPASRAPQRARSHARGEGSDTESRAALLCEPAPAAVVKLVPRILSKASIQATIATHEPLR
eukprot:CAMPEP_0168419064 /NCGR_PEP_ID=MMETSP0228-20121227/32079_1 /TAXON_ID=133427 /ORGANISM="Protoceratium reticulatum, Strain CCCM 535 (=CCMP 1889)" /LENGTH=338 /DNA_ID=CAMNT_0008432941 /DNA_START=72 /DNA_END=1086 /DNA_ORIENTATION=-